MVQLEWMVVEINAALIVVKKGENILKCWYCFLLFIVCWGQLVWLGEVEYNTVYPSIGVQQTVDMCSTSTREWGVIHEDELIFMLIKPHCWNAKVGSQLLVCMNVHKFGTSLAQRFLFISVWCTFRKWFTRGSYIISFRANVHGC
jgi:hypothetical protein